MRLVISLVSLVGLVGWYVSDDPQEVARVVQRAVDVSDHWLHDKQIDVSGNSILEDESIIALLPCDKNNLWWRLHRPELAISLLSNRLIKEAEVIPCSALSWDCFRVRVIEREPRFLAIDTVGKKLWVAGSDGRFISSITENNRRGRTAEEVSEDLGGLIMIEGLFASGMSSEGIQNRLLEVSKTLPLIMQGVSAQDRAGRKNELKIASVTIVEPDELRLKFAGVPPEIVIDKLFSSPESLIDKGKRLRALLLELGPERVLRTKKIDLSYNRLGVVKFSEE